MSSSRIIGILVGLWLAIVGVYALVSVAQGGHPQAVSTFGNIVQCIVPLLANAGLLLNAGTPHWRRNIFWMLLAMSCTLWMIGQFEWTYYEVYQHQPMPTINTGDIIFFLKGIPIMAALALQPHRKRGELRLQVGYLNFVLLFTWWAFVYAFVVFPWMYATPSEAQYNYNYDVVTNVQNMVIVIGLGVLWLRAKGAWRVVYANLFGGAAMYMLSSLTINVAISMHKYSTGSAYDLPLISSFLWFGLAGVVAYVKRGDLDSPQDTGSDSEERPRESMWSARLAMAAVISLPVFAIVTLRFAHDAPTVRDFRLMTTLIASVPIAFLVFLRTHLADADRARLLARSEQSVENLQRLQAQMVQTEKLVSLGQLAAGAAHEINNPLAAILGFSDLLADDPTLPEKARAFSGNVGSSASRSENPRIAAKGLLISCAAPAANWPSDTSFSVCTICACSLCKFSTDCSDRASKRARSASARCVRRNTRKAMGTEAISVVIKRKSRTAGASCAKRRVTIANTGNEMTAAIASLADHMLSRGFSSLSEPLSCWLSRSPRFR